MVAPQHILIIDETSYKMHAAHSVSCEFDVLCPDTTCPLSVSAKPLAHPCYRPFDCPSTALMVGAHAAGMHTRVSHSQRTSHAGVKGLVLSWSRKRNRSHEEGLKEPLLACLSDSIDSKKDAQPHEVHLRASSEHRAVEGSLPSGSTGGAASPDATVRGKAAAKGAAATSAAAGAQKEGGEHAARSENGRITTATTTANGSAPTAATPAGSSAHHAADGSTAPVPSVTGGGAGRLESGAGGGGGAAAAGQEGSSSGREGAGISSKHGPHVTLDVLPHSGSAVQEAEGTRTRTSSSPSSSVAGGHRACAAVSKHQWLSINR